MKVYIKNFPTVHPTLPNSRLWCTEVLFVHKFTSWTFRELVMCTILRMVNLLFALGESPLFLGKFNNIRLFSIPSSSSLCLCTSSPDSRCPLYRQNEGVLLRSPAPRKGRCQWSPSGRRRAEAWPAQRFASATRFRSPDFQ